MNEIMANPNNPESVQAGSSQTVPSPTPDQGTPEGQTVATGGDKNFAELETRFGQQGQELGEYRQFFQNIAPLLDKLDQAPELVQAIVDGKLDQTIAQAVMDGRVDIRDAAIVQQAATTVKENMGAEKFDLATPESITKLVEAEVSKVRKEFEDKAELQTFQDYTQKFIANTPDFEKYSEQIDAWLDDHDVSDIEVAYYAVKGKLSESEAKEAAEKNAAEHAKDLMANAQGGGQSVQYAPNGAPLVDSLISGQVNPNSFFK